MCGIVGFISLKDDLYVPEKAHFMHFALTLDTLRGFDSTGIISVEEGFNVRTQHSLMAGDRFVHSKHYKRNNVKAWAKVGHNRAATKGSVKLQNAHPFTFGPITLVHNGTLTNQGESIKTYDKRLEVDSMQIALALSKAEPGEADDTLEHIDGSFALVWTDTRDKSINMTRNSDRPIHFCYNPAKEIMWFMSDGMHLKSINKSLFRRQAEGGVVYQMDKYKILKFKKGSLVPEVTTFVPFVRPVNTTHYGKPSNKGGSHKGKSALERAVDKWTPGSGSETKARSAGTGLKPMDMRITVNGKYRKLLLKHLLELRREYELKPQDLLEFVPVVRYKQVNGRYTVFGDIIHRAWGDGEWDAILYNVKPAMANAYMDRSWMVNPVGLSRPHTQPQGREQVTVPSVLCDLINCDWEHHKPSEDPCDPKVPEDSPILVLVGDQEIEAGRLDRMLERGCISCGAAMNMDDTSSCVIVNDGQDLLCAGCLLDMNPTSNEYDLAKGKLN